MTENQLTPSEEARIELLIDRMLDAALTDQEMRELESVIGSGAEPLQRYIRSISLRAGLVWDHSIERGELLSVDVLAIDIERKSRTRAIDRGKRFSKGRIALGSAAALLLVSLGFWMRSMESAPLAGKLSEKAESIDRSELPQTDVGAAADEAIADLQWTSGDAAWRGLRTSLRPNTPLRRGEEFHLEKGAARLRFSDGTQVTMYSPAGLSFDALNRCKLLYGGINVLASEINKGGFTVITKNGKIIDIGTEFGVVVDDFGVTEVCVFKGKVLAYPKNESLQSNEPIELFEGDSLQWDVAQQFRFNAKPDRLGTWGSRADVGDVSLRPRELAISDDFSDGSLNAERWKTLGHVTSGNGFVQLGRDQGGKTDGDDVPYLISNEQFDPAAGTIVVTGAVAFADQLDPEAGAISILTRAENERGGFPRKGYAYVATGLRCTFWPVTDVPGETLRILVRPFPAGENVGLLGEEFPSSKVSPHWKFQLLDDGVNVLFTIQNSDDPSVGKTVSCRSLFRGKTNFIAFEGDPNASVRLRDVKVYQLSKTGLAQKGR